MTERHTLDSSIGLAGRLSHLPYGTGKAEDCGWQSSRDFAQNTSIFKELGPRKTWFSAAPARVPHPPSGSAWQQSRRQQRYLLKNHPEAHLGNEVLHEHLLEGNLRPQASAAVPSRSSLLAVGELVDKSELQETIGAPLVATACGDANDIFRLARLDLSKWKWDEKGGVALRVPEMGDEEPCLWEEDAGSIRLLKCIVDHKRYDPTRWLVVQRESGTEVFQPEYQRIPTAAPRDATRDPSHIAANLLFRISKHQTGGNVHTDVSFNPGTRANPPQLGIVDERGFWSVWDITLTKSSKKPVPVMIKCGHIEHGVLKHLPYRSKLGTEWHKLLWVGYSQARAGELAMFGDDKDTVGAQSRGAFPPLERSSLLLICNSSSVRLLDLATGSYLPDLSFLRQDRLGCVLDVHANLQDPQYFFVLTTSRLFVVRVYSVPGSEWGKPETRWSILLSSPHLRDALDRTLKLTVTQGAKSAGHVTSLVFIYSTENAWLDLFCVNASKKDPDMVTCHRETIKASCCYGTSSESMVQTLRVHPATVALPFGDKLTEHARSLADQHVRFYQMTALKSDMSLVSALCTSSTSPVSQISPPTYRLSRPSKPPNNKAKVAKNFSSRFLVPDDLVVENEMKARPLTTQESNTDRTRFSAPRFFKLFYEHLCSAFQDSLQGATSPEDDAFGSNPFDGVHLAVEEALESGSMCAGTLLQLMQVFNVPNDVSDAASEWEFEVKRLNDVDPAIQVMDLSGSYGKLMSSANTSLKEAYARLLDIAASHGSISEANHTHAETRAAMFRQIASDIYLSLNGVRHLKPDSSQDKLDAAEDMVIDSQPTSSPYDTQSQRSVASSRKSLSQEPQQEDPAMALIKAYTGTGKFVPQKQFELLDKWQLGADSQDYVFDLDRSTEKTPGMLRRAKQMARESRKRRRAETLFQMARQPELPSTQPAPDTRFFSSQRTQPTGYSSQPLHSDPIHTMSQPLTGAFGRRPDRPQKKAKKRKGGF
ncbi:Uu.00g074330.m01.CDS01 [Anthostomella pinea]|uniref:Uu.00g074330.m01.CDS01 n=1 Tax=Anthostomella pinea TaxID=933095 RepID=A0AAI8YP05_9PEZI|nr:Uu.00g074330.m01.CDS01 [Anthostomella pinea]